MGYTSAIQKAVDMQADLLITHEPLFYHPVDADPTVFEQFEAARQKKKLIEDLKIAVIRCHDVWDLLGDIGIAYAWAKYLGLNKMIKKSTWCHLYQIEPVTARRFAEYILSKVKPLGQNDVQFVGPEDKIVSRVATGTGSWTGFRHMSRDLGADIAICTYDDFIFWSEGALAIDMNFPVILVNHAITEEPGTVSMAEHLAEKFPQVEFYHIPEKCMYKTIF